jgi:hypothetical protein
MPAYCREMVIAHFILILVAGLAPTCRANIEGIAAGRIKRIELRKPAYWTTFRRDFHFLPIATDETRAGERGVSPFGLQKMLSGGGAYD